MIYAVLQYWLRFGAGPFLDIRGVWKEVAKILRLQRNPAREEQMVEVSLSGLPILILQFF